MPQIEIFDSAGTWLFSMEMPPPNAVTQTYINLGNFRTELEEDVDEEDINQEEGVNNAKFISAVNRWKKVDHETTSPPEELKRELTTFVLSHFFVYMQSRDYANLYENGVHFQLMVPDKASSKVNIQLAVPHPSNREGSDRYILEDDDDL